VGRDPLALAETVAAVRAFSHVSDFQIDLTSEENLQPLFNHLGNEGRLDILVHCAAFIHEGQMEGARIEDLDLQYVTNVRVPYFLTQRLLPLLKAARGQIVFINSSAGLTAKRPDVGQYAATKHALRAIADSLREELNPKGVRVLSVYLGRTATPMQEALFRKEGRVYRPETLLQPEDVASTVVQALMLPSTAEVTDISIRPMINADVPAK
jgi:NAD(P)-dependent dehydrogenase (short-subunit alcohol dehydrogenase family)